MSDKPDDKDDALVGNHEQAICPDCGTPIQDTETPMPVAGPLPVAPVPMAGGEVCRECGSPLPAGVSNSTDN